MELQDYQCRGGMTDKMTYVIFRYFLKSYFQIHECHFNPLFKLSVCKGDKIFNSRGKLFLNYFPERVFLYYLTFVIELQMICPTNLNSFT